MIFTPAGGAGGAGGAGAAACGADLHEPCVREQVVIFHEGKTLVVSCRCELQVVDESKQADFFLRRQN